MLVLSKRNIVIPGPNGQKLRLEKGYAGQVPEWAEKSSYFKALVADRKVIISAGSGKKSPPRNEKRPKLPGNPDGAGEPAEGEP